MRNQQFGFLTMSDTNRPVQSQKQVRGWVLDLESRGIVLSV